MKTVWVLIILTGIGIFLRTNNILPYKIYPDSYVNLLVADNIDTYHSVSGTLGEGGYFFPKFVMWTRPVFPILINIGKYFWRDPAKSAQIIAFGASVIAIPMAYLFVSRVFGSTLVGISASGLLAISFGHVVWSGFILTESLGVLWMIVIGERLFAGLKEKSALFEVRDMLLGILLTIAIFTRYEYVFWLVPITILVCGMSPNAKMKLINILVSLTLTALFVMGLIFPVPEIFYVIFRQLKDQLWLFSMVIGLIGFILATKKFWAKRSEALWDKFRLLFLIGSWGLAIIFTFQFIFPQLKEIPIDLSGLREFFGHDLVLGIFTLCGMTWLWREKAHGPLYLFVAVAIVCLYASYYQINPAMQRYGVHLFPILIIPASYGLSKMINHISKSWMKHKVRFGVSLGSLMILLTHQLYTSYGGMKRWDHGDWGKTAYEEEAAKKLSTYMVDTKPLLIASLPEPYFYFTGQTTLGVSDERPFVNLDKFDNLDVLVILDMSMRRLFPNFTQFVATRLDGYKYMVIPIERRYRFENNVNEANYPVFVYKLNKNILKLNIEKLEL